MSTLLGVFLVFLLIIGVAGFGYQATTGLTDKIQVQRSRKQQLQMKYRDVKQSLTDLKEMELTLNRQLDGVDDSCLGAFAEGGDLITGMQKPASRKATTAHNTIVDVLLAEKLLSPEDLAKAESYKEQSKSPYAIDEILSLLGYVNPDVIQRIKRRYPHLS
ncbi:hypothetical protein N1030_08830 [Desulfovibrio mangrovi]|uniref:hypothetical protein n=1 Tax=Desulfovibrio mangrovi TaxID=2976983 RepID=UPI0022462E76|nr:hypothetical protein [Desulfovibrio mangrovi]UZP69055.1 hypothetical protein N1030_08830 [Desulfovibrio mangrovi]